MQGPQRNVSEWKYSEIRDTINTSTDIELLEECRHEYNRRLNVYLEWKDKNRMRTTLFANASAPEFVMDAPDEVPNVQQEQAVLRDENLQRYFRIPFVRLHEAVTGNNKQTKRAWWFAHFDGQYVARQMELYPEKQAVLLVAGKDDSQLCELTLEETGLARKRGAEIPEKEFNKEWEDNGGPPYVRPADRKQ